MELRPAREEDAAALVDVFAAWDHPQPADVVAERLRTWARTPRAQVLVAELEGAVAGVVAVAATPHFARPGCFARLIGLSVAPAQRRRGVGAALVRAAEDAARGWGCHRLELTSSRWREEAPAFYAALGYEDLSPAQARYAREL